MHAIQIRNFGPPLEVLEHIELPEPSAPASDQVLVGVEFAPMNDLYLIQGYSYLFLIIDELHLVRGSAGTEVSFLIKSLLQRLGLDDPAKIHKLRILASSASLPLDGENEGHSLRYLRDLFAPYGTSQGPGDPSTQEPRFWRDCVVPGKPHLDQVPLAKLPRDPFEALVTASDAKNEGLIRNVPRTEQVEAALAKIAAALGLNSGDAEFVRNLSRRAAEILTSACIDGDNVRATSIDRLADKLFGDKGAAKALRGLMLARALPESAGHKADTPVGLLPQLRICCKLSGNCARADTKVRGRFCVKRCGPSHRHVRNASAVLKNFVRQPEKTFSTVSARSRSAVGCTAAN